MSLFPLHALPDAANLDEEFRLAARFWTTTLVLEADSERARLELRDGRVMSASSDDGPATVRIAASDGDWRELLAPLPRPFYQDLWGAQVHHGVRFEGELEELFPYYPALRRLVELLRRGAHA